jgi:hypothetical protein
VKLPIIVQILIAACTIVSSSSFTTSKPLIFSRPPPSSSSMKLPAVLHNTPLPVLRKAGVLTSLCVMMPLLQTILITRTKIRHPEIPFRETRIGTVHDLKYLKPNYTRLIRATLPNEEAHKHFSNIYEWLKIGELTMNNVLPQDRKSLKKQLTDLLEYERNRRTGMSAAAAAAEARTLGGKESCPTETNPLLASGDGGHDDNDDVVEQTPMMKIINHHVGMMKLTAVIEQLNYGLKLSKETQFRANRLAWRGAVERLRTKCDIPQLPKAVTYSAVRKMKYDLSWDKDEMGDNITPFNLIIKPWPSIQKQANSYLNSLLFDVWMYWFQIWFSLVVAKFILR